MSETKQWAFSLCMSMVACGLARMLLPKSNMEKMFRLTVSVFFLCCLLSPFVLRSPGLRIQVEQYSQEEILRRAGKLTSVLEQQSDDAAKEELKKIIQKKLDEKGINYTSITIHINTNGQNGEAVPTADIELDSRHESQHKTIHKELSAELGLEVRLGYG